MSSDLGLLCHKKNGSALAYKKGGSALIFKGQPRNITIQIPWGPQSYTCMTYSAYHEIGMSIGTAWNLGSGAVLSRTDGGSETEMVIKATSVPARFALTLQASSPCAAISETPAEEPDVGAQVVAIQAGADVVASGNVAVRCLSSRVVEVEIDRNGTLAGIVEVA